ncbi:tetratricopeptide repeat protein [Niastella sp. OAS944]|uniref:tetratricopeptide repeat protein n=1 Tax=Niastella sp. OAS944 TaxID=2664089 RepID=UPI0034796AD2|nr:tetratricopeptide (TPR) repeat protein [Chitinophagaceae bacterium OAS944]
MNRHLSTTTAVLFIVLLFSCRERKQPMLAKEINAINLKTGDVILCGPDDKGVGKVSFIISGDDSLTKQFNFAIALLHSFEYDEAEKVFAKIIQYDQHCAMAYWGVAMCNFHPLWTPPETPELTKGQKALEIAKSIEPKTPREADYINALLAYYNNWEKLDHRTRCNQYEAAMRSLSEKYPNDKEATIFYALAIDAAADPADKTYVKQKKAGQILNGLYASAPYHPGIIHYIIHTYDYPELADQALPAAQKYASVASASAHAQHMPSHIFIRLGMWDESIQSNLASMSAAKCYAENSGIKGHWDEELHAMDYVVYAYLQKKDLKHAKEQWDYLNTFNQVSPPNFKGAYTFAAIPARYVLENRLWKEATQLTTTPAGFPMQQFPWQRAIIHFARALGFIHTNKVDSAKNELAILNQLRNDLLAKKESYKANQVDIQIKAVEGWILLKQGNKAGALERMSLATDMEDKTEKHPVTPGEVLPARELLGDMYLELKDSEQALEAYQADLEKHPNRYNGLNGASQSAALCGKKDLADYYSKLIAAITAPKTTAVAKAQ